MWEGRNLFLRRTNVKEIRLVMASPSFFFPLVHTPQKMPKVNELFSPVLTKKKSDPEK